MENFYQELLKSAAKLNTTYYTESAIKQFKNGCVHYFIGGIDNGTEVNREEIVKYVGDEEVVNRWEKFVLQETALNFNLTFEFQLYNNVLIGIHITGI